MAGPAHNGCRCFCCCLKRGPSCLLGAAARPTLSTLQFMWLHLPIVSRSQGRTWDFHMAHRKQPPGTVTAQ